MIKITLLCALIIQVYTNETPIKLETDSDDLVAEERLLISGIMSKQCKALINVRSPVAPNHKVTITRLGNNGAYYFAPSATTGVTFAAANQFCKDHGMHLVTINSEMEHILVYNEAFIQGYTGVALTSTGAWIGYRDTTGGGNYKWTQPKVGTTPTFFDADAPPVGGQCTTYLNDVPDSVAESWVSIDCTEPLPFICEMEQPCSLFV